MSFLATEPVVMSWAATHLAQIGAAMHAANSAAATPISGVLAAAADEISAATATLFNAFAEEYQAMAGQAAAFHERFAQTLAGSGLSYLDAEVDNALAVLAAPFRTLLSDLGSSGGTTSVVSSTVSPPTLGALYTTLIMDGSGTPIPSSPYMSAVSGYLTASFGSAPSALSALDTPEGLYPLVGFKDLPLDVSVPRGLTILDNALHLLFQDNPATHVAVLGYSQSSVIASLEMEKLAAEGNPYPINQLGFTLLGDPMNPNGGIFSRFAGLSMPSLGMDFYGATPSSTPYPTNIYTLQYDGYGDFPKYPIDFLADLNAFVGMTFVHGDYPQLNPSSLPAGYGITQLPTTTGDVATKYYMITYPGLPLLEPLRAIPLIGNPLADLIQPDLTYLINWGYGDPNYGYSTGYADVATGFGLFPNISPVTFAGDLVHGAQLGAGAFVHDLSAMGFPSASSLNLAQAGSTIAAALPQLAAPTSVDGFIESLRSANTNFSNAITASASTGYATLLPTADIALAVATTLPSYDFNLFLDGIAQVVGGDPMGLVNAIGYPMAASTALLTLAAGFEVEVVLNGAVGSVDPILDLL